MMNKAEKYFEEHPNKEDVLDSSWTEEYRAKLIIKMLTDFAEKENEPLIEIVEDAINGLQWMVDSKPECMDKVDWEKLEEWKIKYQKHQEDE